VKEHKKDSFMSLAQTWPRAY